MSRDRTGEAEVTYWFVLIYVAEFPLTWKFRESWGKRRNFVVGQIEQLLL